MKQITAAEFERAVDLDPAWAAKLTEPVEVTDYCNITRSKITHLSPLLHFIGHDKTGSVASFEKCDNLKVAQGTFNGFVNFAESGIEIIDPENLVITQPDDNGVAASFNGCKNLKVAQGTFHGYVRFNQAGIETIDTDKLIITRPDNYGYAAQFVGCENLKIAQGTFPGNVWFNHSSVEKIDPDKLIITQPNNNDGYIAGFSSCKHLKIAQGKFPGNVDFSHSAIEKIGKLEFQRLNIRNCDNLIAIPEKFITTDMVIMDEPRRNQTENEKKARDLFRQHKQGPIPEI